MSRVVYLKEIAFGTLAVSAFAKENPVIVLQYKFAAQIYRTNAKRTESFYWIVNKKFVK